MTPMPFDRITIQASAYADTRAWLQELAKGLSSHYPEQEVKRLLVALGARLGHPEVHPYTAHDNAYYFVQLLERTRVLSPAGKLPEGFTGTPLLGDLIEDGVAEVQVVERLVLPNVLDLPRGGN